MLRDVAGRGQSSERETSEVDVVATLQSAMGESRGSAAEARTSAHRACSSRLPETTSAWRWVSGVKAIASPRRSAVAR